MVEHGLIELSVLQRTALMFVSIEHTVLKETTFRDIT